MTTGLEDLICRYAIKYTAFLVFAPLALPFIIIGFLFDFAKCTFEIGMELSQRTSDYLARL